MNSPEANYRLKCVTSLTAEAEKQATVIEVRLQQLPAKPAELEKKLAKERKRLVTVYATAFSQLRKRKMS